MVSDLYSDWFSSPFIEERLYFNSSMIYMLLTLLVLVPFYRGAVVFDGIIITVVAAANGSRPLLSRSGCI